MNVTQHTRSCLSIYWVAVCFHFINQTCALYITFDKFFYNCDVVVEKSLYVKFLIHKNTVCIPSPCIMNKFNINLDFWGTMGGCMGCSLGKSAFFMYCVIKGAVDHAPRPVVLKDFFLFLLYKLKHCQFLHNKNNKKDNFLTFSLPIVKKQLSIDDSEPTDSYDISHCS